METYEHLCSHRAYNFLNTVVSLKSTSYLAVCCTLSTLDGQGNGFQSS